MIGADLLCDVLLANGVEVCFANPGTSEMHFVAALDRKPQMRCVLGLFEGVVTGAADGYGRMKDRPAATLLHLGPGLANGLANLHNARRAGTPLLNIVGDHASYHLALDAPLTSDIETLARPMSQWTRRVAGVDTLADDAAQAISHAVSEPGVSTLILPADVAWSEADSPPIARGERIKPASISEDDIRRASAVLRGARNPGLLLGGKALRAEALKTAESIAAKVGARILAGTSNARIERGAGRVAVEHVPYPVEAALQFLREFDALVLIGAREPVAFFAYPGKPGRLVHKVCELVSISGATANPTDALTKLAEELNALPGSHSKTDRSRQTDLAVSSGATFTSETVAAVVAQLLPEHCIVCNESLTSAISFLKLSERSAPHDLLGLTGGSIGIGIPLAVGAAIACPDRKVVGLQADGSAMFTVQGLWTQARERLDVITIVFANRRYAILENELKNVGGRAAGPNARRMLELTDPALGWVRLAEGLGVEAASASSTDEFWSIFKAALGRSGPFLIEVVI
ncbi:acetolactate synthase large subunit [Bradyrhizobium diazoefficiens]